MVLPPLQEMSGGFGGFMIRVADWATREKTLHREQRSATAGLEVHFVSPTPVYSPSGVGAQHAAPLQHTYSYWQCIYETDIYWYVVAPGVP